jgi:hypothetical protein
MFTFKTFNFGNFDYPYSSNISAYENYLGLTQGETLGEIHVPPFLPTWTYQWLGFELNREAQGVAIALKRSPTSDEYFEFNSVTKVWSATSDAVYYSEAEIREYFPYYWFGQIQLAFRVSNPSNQLKWVKIGFYIQRDVSVYLFEYALKEYLTLRLPLTRLVQPDPSGTYLPYPIDLNKERLDNYFFLSFSQGKIGLIAEEKLTAMTPIDPPEPGQLLFTLQVNSQFAYSKNVQITETPTILFRMSEKENRRNINPHTETIRVSETKAKMLSSTHCYDQKLEIVILAHSYGDIQAIADTILAKLADQSYLESPVDNNLYPLQLTSTFNISESSDEINKIYRGTIEARVLGLTEGNYDKEIDIITGITYDNQPVEATMPIYINNTSDPDAQGSLRVTEKAGYNLNPYKVVTVNNNEELIYADCRNLSLAYSVIGITVQSVPEGLNAEILSKGYIENLAWNWNIDQPLFLGKNGDIVQIPLSESVFYLQLGVAITPTKLLIDIQEVVILE